MEQVKLQGLLQIIYLKIISFYGKVFLLKKGDLLWNQKKLVEFLIIII